MRIKHFPAVFVLANILSGPLLGTDTALFLSLFGFFTGWIYLRFYRKSEIASAATGEGAFVRGDASDTFAFVAFFPDALGVVFAPVCDGVYDVLVQMRVCVPFSDEAVEQSNEQTAGRAEGVLPGIMDSRGGGGRREEAERRRALALKALDQRLNAAAGRTTTAPAPASGAASAGEGGSETVSVDAGEPKEAQA